MSSSLLPVDRWPRLDQKLWLEAKRPKGAFEKARRASTWRPATVRMAEDGYGRFLAWLDDRGQLSPDLRPADRVDVEKLHAFVSEYEQGRAELTVAMAVRGVAYIVRATHQPDGLPWLTKIAHQMMNEAKRANSKTGRLATVAELLNAGESLMESSRKELEAGRSSGAQVYRDGLMIAALATRPLRRRNLSELRIGVSFFVNGDRVIVQLAAGATKNKRPIEFEYPDRLVPFFAYYLDKARPILRSKSSDPDDRFLWVGRRGRAMKENDVTARVLKVTKRLLGKAISPHLFRDCVATDIAVLAPTSVGITKSVLGHATLSTSQEYYNQAEGIQAARRHAAVIDNLRGE